MSFLFHSSVVALNVYTLWYDQKYVDLPFPSEELAAMPFKARGLFLTVWCFVLQTIYFAVALLNDLIGTNATAPKKPPLIRKIKDLLFSLAFTVAVYVTAAFWGLYYVHNDLIFPEHIARNFPAWMNHTMHTFIVIFIVIELILSKRIYPTRNLGLSLALLINIAYMSFINYIYFTTGVWVYPFLNIFSWPMKILYFGFSTVVGLIIYVLGEKINSLLLLGKNEAYKNGVHKLE